MVSESLSLSVSVATLSDPELRYQVVLDLRTARRLADVLGSVLLLYAGGGGTNCLPTYSTSRLALLFRLCRRNVRLRKLVRIM